MVRASRRPQRVKIDGNQGSPERVTTGRHPKSGLADAPFYPCQHLQPVQPPLHQLPLAVWAAKKAVVYDPQRSEPSSKRTVA
jgi:hypothetical protein